MIYYGYRPTSYYGYPQSYYSIQQYPTQMFTATPENTAWMIGGLAAAFLFSKVVKFKPISQLGYIAGIGASILALTDFVGIFKIGTVTAKIPEFDIPEFQLPDIGGMLGGGGGGGGAPPAE